MRDGSRNSYLDLPCALLDLLCFLVGYFRVQKKNFIGSPGKYYLTGPALHPADSTDGAWARRLAAALRLFAPRRDTIAAALYLKVHETWSALTAGLR